MLDISAICLSSLAFGKMLRFHLINLWKKSIKSVLSHSINMKEINIWLILKQISIWSIWNKSIKSVVSHLWTQPPLILPSLLGKQSPIILSTVQLCLTLTRQKEEGLTSVQMGKVWSDFGNVFKAKNFSTNTESCPESCPTIQMINFSIAFSFHLKV